MIKISTFLLCTLYFIGNSFSQSSKNINSVINALKHYKLVEKQKFIPYDWNPELTLSDKKNESHLIINPPVEFTSNRPNVDEFFLSDHEVTNLEYKAFVNAIKDSLIKLDKFNGISSLKYSFILNDSKIEINIYPDTSCWEREINLFNGDALKEYYWQHKSFDTYPVIGINWFQANAYLDWLNKRFSSFLKNQHIEDLENWGTFRLPTKDEWICSVSNRNKIVWDEAWHVKRSFSWNGWFYRDPESLYCLANFGMEYTQNNIVSKYSIEDGFQEIAPVKSYKPSDRGIFELTGNVAEWTSSSYHLNYVKQSYQQFYDGLNKFYPDLREELKKEKPDWNLFEKKINSEKLNGNRYNHWVDLGGSSQTSLGNLYHDYDLKNIKKQEVHNYKAIKNNKENAIAKGGSWISSTVGILNSSEEVYDKRMGYSTVGFRVLLDLEPDFIKILGNKFMKQSQSIPDFDKKDYLKARSFDELPNRALQKEFEVKY